MRIIWKPLHLVLAALALILLFILIRSFYKTNDTGNTATLDALKNERVALQKQRAALEQTLLVQQKAIRDLQRKDSLLSMTLKQNEDLITNLKTIYHENIKRIDRYTSTELSRAFAELKD